MKINHLCLGFVCALALVAPAGATLPTPSDAAAHQNANAFLFKAGASDIFEIVTGQLAVQKSANPDVRTFASMLIAHHTQTTNKALATAVSAGVTPPPPELSAMQKSMVTQLMTASPANFDRVFLSQQVAAHQQALALMQAYSARGDVASLRMTAQETVPIIQAHLAQAQRLSSTAR